MGSNGRGRGFKSDEDSWNRMPKLIGDSGRGEDGLAWIRALEKFFSIDDLSSDGPGWGTCSFKLASAAIKIISEDFQRKIMLMEEKMQTEDRVLNGRQ